MTTDPPVRRRRPAPRAVPSAEEAVFDDILSVLGHQLGETVERSRPRASQRKLKTVTFEYEDRRSVHDMAGDAGYSLASNWFTQLLAQLAIAKSITKSELCVFLYVAGGQIKGTGIAEYTQQQITDGLNAMARKTGAPCITRSTVNRAIKALCEYGWVEKKGNGAIRLNIKLWFRGNSSEQHELLAELQRETGDDPEAFPNYIGPTIRADQLPLPLTDGEPPLPSPRQERTG